MKAYYSDHFVLPLPAGHRFPMSKYERLRRRVEQELLGVNLLEPHAATDGELALAHHAAYIEKVSQGNLSTAEIRVLGFPWSEAMVERSRRSVGATVGACRAALAEGVAVNLAGGTHHAYADSGQGYCVFNDAAIAARLMQAEVGRKSVSSPLKVAIVDLDVHQGNGTASILRTDPSIFTLSLHGASNFPFRKELSDLDIALPDGTSDDFYLHALDQALAQLAACFKPQFLIYLAGADAHEGDRLGRLKLTTSGMRARDARVFEFAAANDLSIAVCMAGGYGHDIDITVGLHFNTVATALNYWRRSNNLLNVPVAPIQKPDVDETLT